MPDSKNSEINNKNRQSNDHSGDYVLFYDGNDEITFFNVCPEKRNIAKKFGAMIHPDFKIWCAPNTAVAVAMSTEFTPLTKEELDIIYMALLRMVKDRKKTS